MYKVVINYLVYVFWTAQGKCPICHQLFKDCTCKPKWGDPNWNRADGTPQQ